jgi:hypothetical protein
VIRVGRRCRHWFRSRGQTVDVLRSRLLALALVTATGAACSSHAVAPTSTESPGSAGPVGCLDPRAPSPEPTGGWLPDRTGASDYEPENAGASRPPSASGALLANRVRSFLGHGFAVSALLQFDTARCVVDRDVTLRDGAGDVAFLRVLQLRRPLNDGSFPLVGSHMSRRLAHGSVLLTNHVDDNSVVTAVLARADGLVVELQVRSSTGQDTSGWPTTMGTMPPIHPAVESPVTVPGASVVVQDVAAVVANSA